jgi:hypothetical protein
MVLRIAVTLPRGTERNERLVEAFSRSPKRGGRVFLCLTKLIMDAVKRAMLRSALLDADFRATAK